MLVGGPAAASRRTLQSVLLLPCRDETDDDVAADARARRASTTSTAGATSQQIDELRAEIERLKAERAAQRLDGP